ncbi:MAG TPA: CHAT domain-containing protein, partial [Longimicrobiaceae bacterium]|nr:CHAT domain-containing protein [Longimicrobiaceae bacterium]
PQARYNLALALDRQGLDTNAAAAWRAYLRADATSAWAAEARRRLTGVALPAAPGVPNAPAPGDSAAIDRFAADMPQEARSLGWDHVLDEWGDAVLKGHEATAEARLRFALALGYALESHGRDASLADEVRWIRRTGSSPAKLRSLARAHRDFARGRAEYDASLNGRGLATLARVRSAAPAGSPLRAWASSFYGGAQIGINSARAEALLGKLDSRADSVRWPALAGRTRWLLATSRLRQLRYREARDGYVASARLLARAGEEENRAAVQAYAATAEHHLGNTSAAYASAHGALTILRRHPSSTWLHSTLWALADAAAGDGYLRAASRVLDEDVAITELAGDPVDAAEAHSTRARLLMAMGEEARAARDLAGLRRIRQGLLPAQAAAWIRADGWEAEVAALRHADPAGAVALLDSAVTYWGTQHNDLRLLPPLAARAEARLAGDDVRGAESDLDRVLRLIGAVRRPGVSPVDRMALLRMIGAVSDRIMMRHARAGDAWGALLRLERTRTALLPARLAAVRDVSGHLRTPRGEVAVEYALVGDTLLVWTLRDTAVRLVRRTVNAEALVRSVRSARSALEQARERPENAATADLHRLYDQLIRPVRTALAGAELPITLVPGEAFADVPFAALLDPRTNRYLVQDHPLRVVPSLSAIRRLASITAGETVLVSGAGFDRRAEPGLDPLPGADAEVRLLRRTYPHATVLSGSSATRANVTASFTRAILIHFAGHAVLDDQHPERSRLVLAPGEGGMGGELSAKDLETLRLRWGSVVVLSACETLRSPAARPGGFAGLADGFLAAGAAGVVGSLWRVEDGATLPMMLEFHRAYRERPDGAAALRRAQLRMIGSRDARERSPAGWAAFRYAGN